jgi:hypothetical protein
MLEQQWVLADPVLTFWTVLKERNADWLTERNNYLSGGTRSEFSDAPLPRHKFVSFNYFPQRQQR